MTETYQTQRPGVTATVTTSALSAQVHVLYSDGHEQVWNTLAEVEGFAKINGWTKQQSAA